MEDNKYSGGDSVVSNITWNPLDKGTGIVLSTDNLSINNTLGNASVRCNVGKVSGKHYWEIKLVNGYGYMHAPGISNSAMDLNGAWNGVGCIVWYYSSIYANGSPILSLPVPPDNATIRFKLDLDNNVLYVAVDSETFYTIPNIRSYLGNGTIYPHCGTTYVNSNSTANFGESEFKYSIPEGYSNYAVVHKILIQDGIRIKQVNGTTLITVCEDINQLTKAQIINLVNTLGTVGKINMSDLIFDNENISLLVIKA